MTQNPLHRGACLCQGVRFAIHGPLAPIQICHCSQCRRAQGSAFAANIPVAADQLEFTSGRELLRRYASSPGKMRVFCSVCGSPVFSERASLPGVVRIRAGLLDDPIATAPQFQMHVDSRCSWWPLRDDLPQHGQGHT